jgi:hypothetical protein
LRRTSDFGCPTETDLEISLEKYLSLYRARPDKRKMRKIGK